MAIYHLSIKIGTRSKGQSAVAASAYRSGTKLKDNELDEWFDYTRKSGIAFSEISLCQNAPSEYSDRQILWNEVHKIEKAKDAQLWREIEVALPSEFDRDRQIETVRKFVAHLVNEGMCADWSLHDKNDGNPHAHIMLTTRSIKSNGEWAPKSKKVYDLDENGERIFQKVDKSGRKQYKCHKENYNDWNLKDNAEKWRALWAECCNEQLDASNRIDHRSYERQGIDRIPTIHEGYSARKRAAQGLDTDRVNINREIRQMNQAVDQNNMIAISLHQQLIRYKQELEEEQMMQEIILKTFQNRRKRLRKAKNVQDTELSKIYDISENDPIGLRIWKENQNRKIKMLTLVFMHEKGFNTSYGFYMYYGKLQGDIKRNKEIYRNMRSTRYELKEKISSAIAEGKNTEGLSRELEHLNEFMEQILEHNTEMTEKYYSFKNLDYNLRVLHGEEYYKEAETDLADLMGEREPSHTERQTELTDIYFDRSADSRENQPIEIKKKEKESLTERLKRYSTPERPKPKPKDRGDDFEL